MNLLKLISDLSSAIKEERQKYKQRDRESESERTDLSVCVAGVPGIIGRRSASL